MNLIYPISGTLLHAVLNAPGSWHDAKVARALYELLLGDSTPDSYYLVADTAFPRSTPAIRRCIRTALKSTDRLPANLQERQHLSAVSRQLLSYRQTAEWGMREIRGAFGRL